MNCVVFCLRLFIHGKVFNSKYYGIELFILESFKSLQSFRFRRFVVKTFLFNLVKLCMIHYKDVSAGVV